MSDTEDLLRRFRPTPESEGFWDRVREEAHADRGRKPRPRRWGWGLAAAAALLFGAAVSVVTVSDPHGGSPRTAEETLGRSRGALETSESACIRFTLEPDPSASAPRPEAPRRRTGVVFLKQGNKLNLSVKEWAPGESRGIPEAETRLISDGSRMERCLLRRGAEVNAERMKPPPVARGLARWFLAAKNLSSWPAVGDLETEEPIRNLKIGPVEGGASVLTYTAGSVSIKLWYDPVGYKVLKRELRSGGVGTVTETFQEYDFNEDMPDSYFVLAEEK